MGAAHTAHQADTVAIAGVDRLAPTTPLYAVSETDSKQQSPVVVQDAPEALRQLLQWLVIFAVVGVLIFGAKWWSSHRAAATAPPASTASQASMIAPVVHDPADVPHAGRTQDAPLDY